MNGYMDSFRETTHHILPSVLNTLIVWRNPVCAREVQGCTFYLCSLSNTYSKAHSAGQRQLQTSLKKTCPPLTDFHQGGNIFSELHLTEAEVS